MYVTEDLNLFWWNSQYTVYISKFDISNYFSIIWWRVDCVLCLNTGTGNHKYYARELGYKQKLLCVLWCVHLLFCTRDLPLSRTYTEITRVLGHTVVRARIVISIGRAINTEYGVPTQSDKCGGILYHFGFVNIILYLNIQGFTCGRRWVMNCRRDWGRWIQKSKAL